MKTIRKHNKGFQQFLAFWSKYAALDSFHEQWAKTHIKIIQYRKNAIVLEEGSLEDSILLVSEGMLARIEEDEEENRRKILSIALPGMALFSSWHLYSKKHINGNIVALRSSRIISISYKNLKAYKDQDKAIDILIDVLGNKKKKQMMQLRGITLGQKPFRSCIRFLSRMPQLHTLLTQQEQADLLGVSKTTLQSAIYYMAKGKLRN
ncbi:Crp/Fnr family transcriptional regulator [Sphingobacterium sp. LRF_L2]|uniref:Crp/Fnr family transcriptional regulator n=1 Tax=Sphingobacterium sp. LRF_L2 TaxID=3369421 RepID=UPI003F61C0C0